MTGPGDLMDRLSRATPSTCWAVTPAEALDHLGFLLEFTSATCRG
ncbi:hypothetical protein ACFTZB_39005 [Rhodococcus sp. NPDC057014]